MREAPNPHNNPTIIAHFRNSNFNMPRLSKSFAQSHRPIFGNISILKKHPCSTMAPVQTSAAVCHRKEK